MGLFGALASGIGKFGQLASKAIKPLGNVASVVGDVAKAAGAALPGPLGLAAKAVGGIAGKVSDFVQSGKAQDVLGKIGTVGSALTGLANPMPRSDAM